MVEGKLATMPPKIIRGNAVADAFFRNKLAEPKQNHRAGDHYGNIGELVQERNLAENSLSLQHRYQAESLQETERNGQKSGILVELLPTRLAFFLIQFFELGKNHSEELHYD